MVVVIRISIWIEDRIEVFFTICRNTAEPNVVQPSGEHNRRNYIGLVEVCSKQ